MRAILATSLLAATAAAACTSSNVAGPRQSAPPVASPPVPTAAHATDVTTAAPGSADASVVPANAPATPPGDAPGDEPVAQKITAVITKDSPPKPAAPSYQAERAWAAYRARECYASRLASAPDEAGRLRITVRVGVTEPTNAAKVEESTVSVTLRDCVADAVRTMKYAPRDFSDCFVVFVFDFVAH